MNRCRLCKSPLDAQLVDLPAPGITSLSTPITLPTQLYLCKGCGHAQSPNLPDLATFYDTEYRISLQSDAFDQLYETGPEGPVYRTGHQARLVAALDLPQGARVLDYGAGKASTLSELMALRPDLDPHVFDVSEDYVAHWEVFVPARAQATYSIPKDWHGCMDVVMAHFALEHVADPVGVLQDMARTLRPGGLAVFLVPDSIGNPGDLLVVDHLNHFTRSSLLRLLAEAGLGVSDIRTDAFRGAFLVCARAGAKPIFPDPKGIARDVAELRLRVDELGQVLDWIARCDCTLPVDEPLAVYGAGFYGTMLCARLTRPVACFLDMNPHLQGTTHMGLQVYAPADCPPEIAHVLVGLNPARARHLLFAAPDWLPARAQIHFPH